MTKSRNVVPGHALHFPFKLLSAALLLLAFFLSGSNGFAQTIDNEAKEAEEEARWLDLPFEVSGSYGIDYWGRWNSKSAPDQDLFQYLRLDVNDIVPNKVSATFFGRLSAELNGRRADDNIFFDILDTWDSDFNGRVYYLYVDIKDPIWERSNLRIGRMYSYEAQTVFLTGAKYEQTIDRFRYYLQGGIWASNYQHTDVEDDMIGGLGFDYQLFPYTSVGYDYLRVVDDELDDDYHSFDIYQRFGSLSTYAQFSLLNGDADELNLFGTYYHAPLDLNLTARYYTLLSPREKLTNQFSALIDLDDFDAGNDSTVGTLFPFNLVDLSVYKGWGERFGTTVGYETRWMQEDDEQNNFNREYDLYFVTFEVWNFLTKGLTAAFLFEYWDVNAAEDSISGGVDLEKVLSKSWEAGGGFYYSRYRVRYTFDGENFSDEIETPEVFGWVKYRVKENIELLARCEIENEDTLGTTYRLRLGCEIDF
jgi:hypothetical protein